ncbi:MAG: amidohydrolase family protein [Desulfobacteraceae bacterium]|nr:amidohydrolase family protein [Desulfobacteraceae bacterium]
MGSILIHNIGTLITGDIVEPINRADSIYIDNGIISEVGTGRTTAEVVIDARGSMVTPGLIDSHVHPTFGDFTPVQNSTNWITNYLHGGVTRMVSAGELHLPGLPIDKPDPQVFRSLALVTRACYDRYRPSGVKVEAGTLLLVPGLSETDFEAVAVAGSKCVKFIFYPYGVNPEEQANYVTWAKERNMRVKIHSGGVSRSGVSRPAGADVVLNLKPDIVGHINGGPIPMPLADIARIVAESDYILEVAYCGNHAIALKLMETVVKADQLHRVILGTDTPSGTGVTPRGMLRIMAVVASVEGVPPEKAVCMATGGPALAHGLDSGFIKEGKPADVLIMGKIQGSSGATPLEALKDGNLLGISMALIDGRIVIRDRSLQTPPPEIGAIIESGA